MTKSQTTLQFLGAAGTVTGSKTLISHQDKKVLIDCGLFQGLKELRLKNWEDFEVNPSTIDEVILTHAHLDHCGYLPKLVNAGFNGPIHCTSPTKDLVKIILEDSAKIQEEEADRANKYGYSSHKKAKPLYNSEDVARVLPLLVTHEYSEYFFVSTEMKFQFHNAGHILGAAIIEAEIGAKKIVFSGDIGTYQPLLLTPPKHLKEADYIVIESTYGDRLHPEILPEEEIKQAILKADEKNGILIIPTFAVERAQEIIYLISVLKSKDAIPDIPVFLDSPMGANATEVFLKYPTWHKLGEQRVKQMCSEIHIVKNIAQSISIREDEGRKIILAGSGMITGGRVLHHLSKHISNPKTTVLLAGFQAAGTRGRQLQEGVHEIKFFGKWHQVKAEIIQISSLSAHGDQNDMLKWLGQFGNNPRKVFINHGEANASHTFKLKIQDALGLKAQTVQHLEKVELD
ncbi:MAG: MBL fold metallo-hydrolase [Salibacteraceae bacterium]